MSRNAGKKSEVSNFDPTEWVRSVASFNREPVRKLAKLPVETKPHPKPKHRREGASVVVIPDAHAKPGTNQSRFDALGNALVEWAPDYLVSIGDLSDVPSLSTHGDIEGESYAEDIAVTVDALARITEPAKRFNKRKPESRRLPFTRRGRQHITLGNHEWRVVRTIESDPARFGGGVISLDDFRFEDFGFIRHDYGSVLNIEGLSLSHIFPSGVMGRPIGGATAALSLIRTNLVSSIAGHSHLLDYSEKVRASDGRRIQGMTCGCFFDYPMTWTTPQVNAQYRSGILRVRDLVDGEFDYEWVSQRRLEREFL